ncbi:MAG: hypothetical protein ACI9MR_001664, partial [Myxococcota bacterium]
VNVASCMVAVCLPDGNCGPIPLETGTACDNADPCTIGEVCGGGICGGGSAAVCDDADPCTQDLCEASVGCSHPPVECAGAGPCTIGTCDGTTGVCTLEFLDDGTSCDDGLPCTEGEAICDSGLCASLAPDTCDDGESCTDDRCKVDGCEFVARAGSCDDADACTEGDTCDDGTCSGEPIACDDDNACTADACEGDGEGCVYVPIVGCADPIISCVDRAPGASCSDGDPLTVADICVDGACAGFVSATVAPTGGAIQDGGWRLTSIDHVGGTWFAAMALDGTADARRGMLAAVDLAGTGSEVSVGLTAFDATRTLARYSGLHEGFALGDDGILWEFENNGVWSTSGPYSLALAATGTATTHGLFVQKDLLNTVFWVVGTNTNGPSIRRCETVLFGIFEPTCESQTARTNEPHIFRAVAASLLCPEFAPCGLVLAAGADLFDSTGANGVPRYYNDLYGAENIGGADWTDVLFDPGASAQTTEAMIGLEGGDGLFVAVGRNGYLRDNAPTGEWSAPSAILDAQSEHHFYGVATVGDVIAIAAWRHVPGEINMRENVLLTAAIDSALDEPASWTRSTLGIASGAESGIYDVYGEDGEIVVVGGTTSAAGRGEGLLYVRRP